MYDNHVYKCILTIIMCTYLVQIMDFALFMNCIGVGTGGGGGRGPPGHAPSLTFRVPATVHIYILSVLMPSLQSLDPL